MALRAKVRGQMRTVSPAMARRLRAKGVRVTDDTPPLPEQPTPNMVATVVEMPGTKSATVAAKIEALADVAAKGWGEPPAESTFDLTDEELEKLTAPES